MISPISQVLMWVHNECHLGLGISAAILGTIGILMATRANIGFWTD